MTNSEAPDVVIDDLTKWEELGQPEEPAPEAPSGAEITDEGYLTKDAFWGLFKGAFQIGSAATGLTTLNVEDDDAGARAASDAVYDTCHDTPSLHFMIRPDSVWVERAIVVGAFAMGKASGVKSELIERRRARVSTPDEPKGGDGGREDAAPVNDNPVNAFPVSS